MADNNCECGGRLVYVADLGAPGVGQSWECAVCGEAYYLCGSTKAKFSDLEPDDVTTDEYY